MSNIFKFILLTLLFLIRWWIQPYPTDSVMIIIFVTGVLYNLPRFFEFQVISVDTKGFLLQPGYEKHDQTHTSLSNVSNAGISGDSDQVLKDIMDGKYNIYTVRKVYLM